MNQLLQEKRDAEQFLRLIAPKYTGVFIVDRNTGTFRDVLADETFRNYVKDSKGSFLDAMQLYRDHYVACDYKEVIDRVLDYDYVRLGRLGVEDVYDENYKYEFGKGTVLKKGSKVAIIASGLMVQESLKAYDLLENKPTIIDIPTIKPIDKELIIETAKTHDVIVTVEEHNIYGGLGSAVSEVLAPEGIACRQYMLGMQDTFGRSGKPKELLDYYGLDAKHIKEFVESLK